jgi:hypothetical protein
VPAGKYLLWAVVNIYSYPAGTTYATCDLTYGVGPTGGGITDDVVHADGTLPLIGMRELTSAGPFRIRCLGYAANNYVGKAQLIALRVS